MIHSKIMDKVQAYLEANMVDAIDPEDPDYTSLVKLGPLQGDPDPDEARIFVTIHENDPDTFITGVVTGMDGKWVDEIEFREIGGSTTWKRRFTAKIRLLLETTREDETVARQLASTLRTRIEHLLEQISFSGISEDGEYVSEPIREIYGEMIQAGGPPDSYDFQIKVRFGLKTTTRPIGG